MAKRPTKASSGKSGIARSAVTGKYVKDSYAKSHPKTTVVESRPKGSPGGTKGAGSRKKK